MSKLAVGLGMCAVVIGGAALWMQQNTSAELRGEIAQLREQVARLEKAKPASAVAVTTPAGNAAPASGGGAAADRAELEKLRADVAALQKSAEGFSKTSQVVQAAVAARLDSAKPTDLTPANAWKNAGHATPQAAIETMIWAASGGDLENVAQSVAFLPSAQGKANALFASLSPERQAQYGSPEKLLAVMIANDVSNVQGMQVLGQREVDGADNVGIRVRFGNQLGQTKDDSFLVHRGTDGNWKLMLSEAAVDKFSNTILAGPGKK